MPILSNGHLAAQTLGDSVYMNGLYNGERGLSHRARIPNYSNIIIDPGQFKREITRITYRMNYRQGVFETIIQVNNRFTIRHWIYAHRHFTRAIVNEISIKGNEPTIHNPPGDGKPLPWVEIVTLIYTFLFRSDSSSPNTKSWSRGERGY